MTDDQVYKVLECVLPPHFFKTVRDWVEELESYKNLLENNLAKVYEEKYALEEKLKKKYDSRLEKIVTAVLPNFIINGYMYTDAVKAAIDLAKITIVEIDNDNR